MRNKSTRSPTIMYHSYIVKLKVFKEVIVGLVKR